MMKIILSPTWDVGIGSWGPWYIYVLLKYGHENAEMQKKKKKGQSDDVTLRYSVTQVQIYILQNNNVSSIIDN